jgi:hypothetical protein
VPLATLNARDACRCRSCAWVSGSGIVLPRALAGDALSPGQTLVDTFFDSHFLGERVGQKNTKAGTRGPAIRCRRGPMATSRHARSGFASRRACAPRASRTQSPSGSAWAEARASAGRGMGPRRGDSWSGQVGGSGANAARGRQVRRGLAAELNRVAGGVDCSRGLRWTTPGLAPVQG